MRRTFIPHRSQPFLLAMLFTLVLAALFALVQPVAQAEVGLEWPDLSYTQVVSGLSSPVQATHAADGSGRLFIVEQGGTIRIWDGSSLLATPFLDISDRLTSGGERGLLGLAFPPDYASKGYFYVNYTDDSGGDTVVSRFYASGDPNVADPTSEEIILIIDQPYANHNGGHLTFGPDGYLYIGTGDGGSGGDPQNNGQALDTLLGKLLRIDVESGVSPYAIPADNPFVGGVGAEEEIWAWGLRNPWRFSFDRETGDLYTGDVGQSQWEEIDFQPASSSGGENYGWRCYEGNHAYNLSGCGPSSSYVFPVVEYDHSKGCSVTGGYVYRGALYPRMQGVYFYGDYCSGRVWGLQNSGGWQSAELDNTPYTISSFGEDEAGNLYLVGYDGSIYLISDSVTAAPARSTNIVIGDRQYPNFNLVIGLVRVADANNQPLPGATVEVTWTRPGGLTTSQSRTTNSNGVARFGILGGYGLYNLTVKDISATGYYFDADNSVLSRDHRVEPGVERPVDERDVLD